MRPSLLMPLAAAAAFATGAAGTLLPRRAADALAAGLEAAAADAAVDVLRDLPRDADRRMRRAAQEVRDAPRGADGQVEAPDVVALYEGGWRASPDQILAAVAKAGWGLIFSASRSV